MGEQRSSSRRSLSMKARVGVAVSSARGATSVWSGFLCALAVTMAAYAPLTAQTLTPRAFWPAPRGTKVLSVGYAYQSGDVLTDPSLPIEGTEAETHGLKGGYLHFFNLAGRTASVTLELPWASTSLDALFEGEARQPTSHGLLGPQPSAGGESARRAQHDPG